jgi:uncharacterized membrane protein
MFAKGSIIAITVYAIVEGALLTYFRNDLIALFSIDPTVQLIGGQVFFFYLPYLEIDKI